MPAPLFRPRPFCLRPLEIVRLRPVPKSFDPPESRRMPAGPGHKTIARQPRSIDLPLRLKVLSISHSRSREHDAVHGPGTLTALPDGQPRRNPARLAATRLQGRTSSASTDRGLDRTRLASIDGISSVTGDSREGSNEGVFACRRRELHVGAR